MMSGKCKNYCCKNCNNLSSFRSIHWIETATKLLQPFIRSTFYLFKKNLITFWIHEIPVNLLMGDPEFLRRENQPKCGAKWKEIGWACPFWFCQIFSSLKTKGGEKERSFKFNVTSQEDPDGYGGTLVRSKLHFTAVTRISPTSFAILPHCLSVESIALISLHVPFGCESKNNGVENVCCFSFVCRTFIWVVCKCFYWISVKKVILTCNLLPQSQQDSRTERVLELPQSVLSCFID